jgi:hypothetical protein
MLIIRTLVKWLVLAAGGLLALVIVLGVGGVQVPWPPTETTQQKPYADFVGREYRVISSVSAHAWNDYPDKAKIQSFSSLIAASTSHSVSKRPRLFQGRGDRLVVMRPSELPR